MTTHIPQFSTGLGSAEVARRVIAEHGVENVVLLTADTLATATTHSARRDALDAAAGVLVRVERASGRVGAVRTYEVGR